MCAHDDSAGLKSLPGAAWTVFKMHPTAESETSYDRRGPVKWLMHACPSARTIHAHVRQTNPCRAECLVVCSHMERHHQHFHRTHSSRPRQNYSSQIFAERTHPRIERNPYKAQVVQGCTDLTVPQEVELVDAVVHALHVLEDVRPCVGRGTQGRHVAGLQHANAQSPHTHRQNILS